MATIAPAAVKTHWLGQLGLIALALGLAVYAYVQVSLNLNGTLPADLFAYSGGLVALSVVFYLIARWRAPHADPVILPVVIALNGIGLAMIYRLDLAYRTMPNTQSDFSAKQLSWTAISMACAVIVLFVLRDHRTLRRYSYLFMVAGLILLLLPLLPIIGDTKFGARIWIHLGPMSFQPGELAKIALAIFFAGYLVTNRDTLALAGRKVLGLQLPRARDLGPILLAWGVSLAVLVFEKDLGTSLLFFGLFVAMLFIATDRLSWIVIGLLLFAAGVVLAYFAFAHVQNRVEIWLNPFDPDQYYRLYGSAQLADGMFGMADGGLFGTGWGLGSPWRVPVANADSIWASLGEELGLTGLLAILVCYLILIERAIRIALGVRDGFGKLLAAGFGFAIALQCFVVIGGVIGLIPMTGLTLPFLAYGGSSLVANWMIAALLLRISDSARAPSPATGELDLGPVLEALDAAEKKDAARRSDVTHDSDVATDAEATERHEAVR